ncbi:unnamed protein product [Discula destructiva]
MRSILLATTGFLQALAAAASAPLVTTKNGTYQGRYLGEWNQDLFLGMPYAQPPLGDLRFRRPQSINTSFSGVREASEYGYSCMQYHTSFNLSEDCLNINVIRPSGNYSKLPVLVWIFGGGLYTGSTADPQYNLSGVVKVSQDMGQPVVAVSMNYRLGMWGFLQTPTLLAEGSSNAGLLDQRLALQWVQENIAAFGGDPSRVVVWGESAGAQSIAYHMFSYDGRDDGLYRGAILESGGPTGAQVQNLAYYADAVENLTRTVGCWTTSGWTASTILPCLRGLDQATLFAAAPAQVWNPLIDGDFLTGYPSSLIRDGKYNAVPLLTGTNTDEGTGFSPLVPNTEQDLFNDFLWWRSYALSPPTIRKFLEIYPNDPCNEPPMYTWNCSVFAPKGLVWRWGAAIGGDMVMHSGRRKMCELFAGAAAQDVFSYRFDTRLWSRDPLLGIPHFDNVAFSFQNISGLLGPSPTYDDDLRIARSVAISYISFVYELDPNPPADWEVLEKVDALPLPEWPRYSLNEPTNMVLNVSGPWVEPDTWRAEGIAYMNTYEVARELLA